MARVTTKEEDAFMAALLDGLDEEFLARPNLTPSSSARKASQHASLPQQPGAGRKGEARKTSDAASQCSSTQRSQMISPSQQIKRAKRESGPCSPFHKRSRRLSGHKLLPRQRSPSAKLPSPRKVKCEDDSRVSHQPLSQTQAKVDTPEESAAAALAAELLSMQEDVTWLDDWDNFLPSPKKRKPVEGSDLRKKLDTVMTDMSGHDLPPVPSASGSSSYVRCRVDEVHHSDYIPERYLRASAGYHTAKGIEMETVTSAMRHKQIVLHMTQLIRIGEEGADEVDIKRTALLRDDWTHTFIRARDIVHLIGCWDQSGAAATNLTPRAGLQHIDVAIEGVAKTTPVMTLSNDATPRQDGCEADNLLILHPDLLLSATAISSVVTCSRKPLLQAKLKASGPGEDDKPSEALVMGRILHEVLQSCLTGECKGLQEDKPTDDKEQRVDDDEVGVMSSQVYLQRMLDCFDLPSTFPVEWHGPGSTNFADGFVKRCIAAQVSSSLDDLVLIGMDTKTACSKLWESTLPFGSFATIYLLGTPSGMRAPVEGSSASIRAQAIDSRSNVPPLVRVAEVYEVEEDIWSPMYGLKGFVDVSVEVEVTERSSSCMPSRAPTRVMMPLELKTGRSQSLIEHRAQTMLYALMMSDRYRRPTECGLLYYSRSAELHLVRVARHEVRGLIVSRNELASYLAKRRSRDQAPIEAMQDDRVLPETIDEPRTCSRCYVVDTCMLYRKAIDRVPAPTKEGESTDAIGSLYSAHTDHLTSEHVTFFRHWDRLLTLEEADSVHNRRELWTMTAAARERKGRCYADMVLTTCPTHLHAKYATRRMSSMLHYGLYRFKRAKRDGVEGEALLLGGNFSVGDAVSVSIEPTLLSIAQGFLLELTSHHIVVGLDRRLEPIARRAGERKPVFRIDREEQVSSMARIRYNLAKLFFAPPAGDVRRRDLIVDLQPPRFVEADATNCTQRYDEVRQGLNGDQVAALDKVLTAQDYALIVGMPGTGKTTTIARLITLLARRGKTVLLASYTHSAVDTICRKLIDVPGVELLRLGAADRVHADVQPYTLPPSANVEQMEARLICPNVVATTCLSISHPLFSLRTTFDYCIIDEASQITLPACIGPLRYANTFVLVGDPQQLPPLVRDERARAGGLDVSLFERLQRAHPSAVVQLCQQYRMNEDIMALSNTLVYDGRLRCGDAEVAVSALMLPQQEDALRRLHFKSDVVKGCRLAFSLCPPTQGDVACWLARALDPTSRALFLNTESVVSLYDERQGDLVENGGEARMVMQLCSALVAGGAAAEEIAVLTPYRQQIRRLTQLLHNEPTRTAGDHTAIDLTPVEVLTADKSQGRDKDIVIVSFVRSQADDVDGGLGHLLHDVRRINVSLTRARKKLIILGNRRTLARAPLLSRLWTLMDKRGWTHTLNGEGDGVEAHWLPHTPELPPVVPSSSPPV